MTSIEHGFLSWNGCSEMFERRGGGSVSPILLIVFGLTVPIPNSVLFPEPLRLAVMNNRPLLVVVLATVLSISTHSSSSHPITRPRNVLAALGLAFPLYLAVISAAKFSLDWSAIGLYASWSLFAFYLVPRSLPTAGVVRRFMFSLSLGYGLMIALCLIATAVDSALLNPVPWMQDRYSFSFLNPNYFAQVCQVFVVSSLYAYMASDRPASVWYRSGVLISVTLALLLVVLADSRSTIVFLSVATATYAFLRARRTIARPVITIIMLLFAVIFAPLVLEDRNDVNGAVTGGGRTELWHGVIAGVFETEGILVALIVGTDLEGVSHLDARARYDPVADQRRFDRDRLDNAYLEIWRDSGIVGLVLFLLPIAYIWRRTASRLRREPLNGLLCAVLAGALAQGVFVSLFPSFGNPVGFLLLVVLGALPLFAASHGSVNQSQRGLPSLRHLEDSSTQFRRTGATE
jgi:hypothetical protein